MTTYTVVTTIQDDADGTPFPGSSRYAMRSNRSDAGSRLVDAA
jgi:hypothetical protein